MIGAGASPLISIDGLAAPRSNTLARDSKHSIAPSPLKLHGTEVWPRVLVDLSHAADGYVGIAQDIRLIFAMLSEIPDLRLSGLLMPAGRHDLPKIRPGCRDASAMTAAVLHWMQLNWTRPPRRPFPLGLLQRVRILRQIMRTRHHLLAVSDRGQLNALWRILFAKTLEPQQRELLLDQDFYATDLSVSSIIERVVHPPVPLLKRLDAQGFDAVLFCMPRPVRLPASVRQIIRFHDAVPLTDTDTVVGWTAGVAHSRLVRACDPDAIFVCNSPQTREALVAIDPARAKSAVVIPCAVAPTLQTSRTVDIISVIEHHVTFRACGPGSVAPADWVPPEAGMRYVLSVSTLEPRKNFVGLIKGWERAAAGERARQAPASRAGELRLVIVGGPGWREEETLARMTPGVKSGRILHLQNVPQDELQALMSGAVCYAFTSFNEGFGYSPLEAMQAGAPCVVSDLAVFRWIFGDAVLYVNPYDSDSIASGIERLASGGMLRDRLLTQSDTVLARFRPAAIRGEWEALLGGLRS